MGCSFITVEPLALLFMACVMCEYTLIQNSISLYHCFHTFNTTSVSLCESGANVTDVTQANVTRTLRYYNGTISLFCSLAVIFIGAWSDWFGRRFPIILAIAASCIAQIMFIVFWLTLDEKASNIYLIFMGAIISGLSGSSTSMMANGFGYIADITSVQNRSRAMIIMEAMVYLGESFGFLAGSRFSKLFRNQLAWGFVLLFVLHFCMLIYSAFFLRESKATVQKISFSGLFQVQHVYSVFRTVFRRRAIDKLRKKLLIIVGCTFLAQTASHSLTSILYIYVRNAPLYWSTELYGYLNAANIVLNGATLLILMPLSIRYYPNLVKDEFFAILGFASLTFALLYLSFATTTALVFIFPIIFLFKELIMPSLRSMVSKTVEEDEKGKSFAFLAILANLSFFFGSQSSSFIYSHTSKWFPGFIFQILALISSLPAIVFIMQYKSWIIFDNERFHQNIADGPTTSTASK